MTQAEYQDMHKNVAYRVRKNIKIYDIIGDDADELLNTYLSKNNEFTNEDTVSYQLILDDNGKFVADVIVYKLEERYRLFSKYNLMDVFSNISEELDFSIRIIDDQTLIQLEGEKSSRIVSEYYQPYDIATLEFKSIVYSQFCGHDFLMARFGFTGELGYQIVIDSNLVDDFIHASLENVPIFDDDLADFTNFEVGQPLLSLLETGEFNIQELGYLWNVDFTNDNFLGRRALVRQVETASQLVIGFISDDVIRTNDSVYFDDLCIGKIVWVHRNLNTSLGSMGLALVNKIDAISGIDLLVRVDKAQAQIRTISSPYKIPESW